MTMHRVPTGGAAFIANEPGRSLGARFRFAVMALFAAGLDALLIGQLGAGALSAAGFAVLHLLLASGAALGSSGILADRTHAVLLGIGLAVMGPFGAIGAILVFLGDRTSARRRLELEEWYRRLSGQGTRDRAEILVEDILEGRAYQPSGSVEHFAHVLATGSVTERQAVLGLLVQYDERGSIDLMTSALRSPDVAVRASAAASIARMRETEARAARPAGSGP